MEQGNYSEDLMSDLNDMLAAAKGEGITKIATPKLVQRLVSMGYSVNDQSILELLNGNPFVASADETQTTLGSPEDAAQADGVTAPPPSAEQKVDSMAQTALKKG